MLGNVLRQKYTTPPDALVLSILQPKLFNSAATEWGIQQEPLLYSSTLSTNKAMIIHIWQLPHVVSTSVSHTRTLVLPQMVQYLTNQMPRKNLAVWKSSVHIHTGILHQQKPAQPLDSAVHWRFIQIVLHFFYVQTTLTMHRCRAKWALAINSGVTS